MTAQSPAERRVSELSAWVVEQFRLGTLHPSLVPHLSNELERIGALIAEQETDHRQELRDAGADLRELEYELRAAQARAEEY